MLFFVFFIELGVAATHTGVCAAVDVPRHASGLSCARFQTNEVFR